jgi:hypothetical protein
MTEFKIGDSVKTYVGRGTICNIKKYTGYLREARILYGVKHIKRDLRLHECDGTCEDKYGYYFSEKNIKLFIKKKINESEMIL